MLCFSHRRENTPMAYQANRYQAERLAAALDRVRAETCRYLERVAAPLAEALEEECADPAREADALSEVIEAHFAALLAQAVTAVSAHYEIDSPARLPRQTPRPPLKLALRPEKGELVRHYRGRAA